MQKHPPTRAVPDIAQSCISINSVTCIAYIVNLESINEKQLRPITAAMRLRVVLILLVNHFLKLRCYGDLAALRAMSWRLVRWLAEWFRAVNCRRQHQVT